MLLRSLLLSLLFLSLTACNSKSNPPAVAPTRQTYEGDLNQLSHQIYEQEDPFFLYDCDNRQKQMVYEISAALEENRDKIIALKSELVTNNTNNKIVTLNGFDFIEQTNKVYPDEWVQDRYSWTGIYKTFLQIKDDLKNPKWVYLNSSARSLILEDNKRIDSASHPGFSRANKDSILRVSKILSDCFDDENCTNITLQPDDEAWLRQGKNHSYCLDVLTDDYYSFEVKRRKIKFLRNDISYGASRYGFEINDSIKVENGTLIVPLDLEILGEDADTFTDLLENTWGVFDLKLKVINSKDGFKLNISKTPGQRPFVNFNRRVMQLFEPSTLSAAKHEFGHILGLEDTYYTSFDQNTCEYVDDSNAGDIMSDYGQVLPVHIEQIKKAYGL